MTRKKVAAAPKCTSPKAAEKPVRVRKAKPKVEACADDVEVRVARFFEANKARKALEREEDGHKDWFKELSRGLRPFSAEAGNLVVTVTEECQERIDLDELRKVVTPDVIESCTKTATFTKVTVRERKDEAA